MIKNFCNYSHCHPERFLRRISFKLWRFFAKKASQDDSKQKLLLTVRVVTNFLNKKLYSVSRPKSFKDLAWKILLFFLPSIAYAENIDYSDPWDRALYAVLQLMTGPTATTIGAIALAGTGYLFLRGRIDVMRLLAIVAGLGLIFGAPHLVSLLQQQV